jgi:hypothetical protein
LYNNREEREVRKMPKGKEIPKRVGAVIKQGSTRLAFVDNQEQFFSTYLIHCSQCGRVVYSLDSTISGLAGSVKALEAQMLEAATYCPMCGHKLHYEVLDIIEGDFIEHREPTEQVEQAKVDETVEEKKDESKPEGN